MREWREKAVQIEQRRIQVKLQPKINGNGDSEKKPLEKEEEADVLDSGNNCDDTITSETLATEINYELSPRKASPTKEIIKSSDFQQQSTPKLIRSNSYTLDTPSPLLLKFLADSTSRSEGKTPDKASKPLKIMKIVKKTTTRKLSDPSAKLRRIYDIKPPIRKSKSETLDDTKRRLRIHSSGEKVEQFFGTAVNRSKSAKNKENLKQKPQVKKSKTSPNLTSKQAVNINSPFVPQDEVRKMLAKVALEHKQMQADLLFKQQEEQKRLNDLFHLQQEELMIKLQNAFPDLKLTSEMDSSNRTSTPLMVSATEIQSNNETSFYSTIRGDSPEFNNSSMSLVSEAYSRQYLSSIRQSCLSPGSKEREIKHRAATIISSHARGYLIRRLFRTEHVQNIIENVKNILFVIVNSNPGADNKTKRNLLKQLNEYLDGLHQVFFSKSTKDRMEIIAKDRKRLLFQLQPRKVI